MKKVFRTFILTLAAVVVAGAIGGFFYIKSNPDVFYGFVGCEATEKGETETETEKVLEQLLENDTKAMTMLESLYVKQIVDSTDEKSDTLINELVNTATNATGGVLESPMTVTGSKQK